MNAIPLVREMHAWMRWCTGRTTSAARTLTPDELRRPFEMGLGSVFGTLVHLYGAERLWLTALRGEAPVIPFPNPSDYASLDALATDWDAIRTQWDAFLNALNDREMERIVIRVREGKEYKQRVVDGLLQLPTHALYHNAQMSAMFRSMGKPLPDSSYILWAREQVAERTPVHS